MRAEGAAGLERRIGQRHILARDTFLPPVLEQGRVVVTQEPIVQLRKDLEHGRRLRRR